MCFKQQSLSIVFVFIRRTFTCESKIKNCTVSTDPEARSFTPPRDLCNHHCSSCTGCSNTTSAVLTVGKKSDKKPKTHNKKPLLKSIILSTKKSLTEPLKIKRELDEDDSTCEESHSKAPFDIIVNTECTTPKQSEPLTAMQFTDTKKTKQINSYFKSNDFVQQNARSYSPPLPAAHRPVSTVLNDTHQTGNSDSRRPRSSRDRKSRSKKRKKRRRSYSRDSRTKSR